ncbi:hypothetical protein [Cetobacterium sp.]
MLKDRLNIAKITFTSGVNTASTELLKSSSRGLNFYYFNFQS